MPKYDVEVIRTVSETKVFRVEADDLEQARSVAVAEAANSAFNNPGCPTYEIGYASRFVQPPQQS
jgi:phosphoribosylformylglycinamidine (FGAM) synthase PurS component